MIKKQPYILRIKLEYLLQSLIKPSNFGKLFFEKMLRCFLSFLPKASVEKLRYETDRQNSNLTVHYSVNYMHTA